MYTWLCIFSFILFWSFSLRACFILDFLQGGIAMDGWMDGRMGGRTDGWMHSDAFDFLFLVSILRAALPCTALRRGGGTG